MQLPECCCLSLCGDAAAVSVKARKGELPHVHREEAAGSLVAVSTADDTGAAAGLVTCQVAKCVPVQTATSKHQTKW